MNFIKILFSFLFLIIQTISSASNTTNYFSTNCRQEFHFFFLSEGNQNSKTFWIGEDLSGECKVSRLLNIYISDTTVSFQQSDLAEYKNWECIIELSSVLKRYEEQTLQMKDNIFRLDGFKISPPKYDSALVKEFNEHIIEKGSGAVSWFHQKGKNGIMLPEIKGFKLELLFYYKKGLYINYSISRVIYFPNEFLLIFTNQNIKSVGGDSMYGFFIFKIEKL